MKDDIINIRLPEPITDYLNSPFGVFVNAADWPDVCPKCGADLRGSKISIGGVEIEVKPDRCKCGWWPWRLGVTSQPQPLDLGDDA